MKKLFLTLAILCAAGAGYAASEWTNVYANPSLPERLCFKNDPQNGYIPVVMVFESEPTQAAAADGAKPVQWVEVGRIPSATALAAYNAVEVLQDNDRPPAFPNPRPVIDAGPQP